MYNSVQWRIMVRIQGTIPNLCRFEAGRRAGWQPAPPCPFRFSPFFTLRQFKPVLWQSSSDLTQKACKTCSKSDQSSDKTVQNVAKNDRLPYRCVSHNILSIGHLPKYEGFDTKEKWHEHLKDCAAGKECPFCGRSTAAFHFNAYSLDGKAAMCFERLQRLAIVAAQQPGNQRRVVEGQAPVQSKQSGHRVVQRHNRPACRPGPLEASNALCVSGQRG